MREKTNGYSGEKYLKWEEFETDRDEQERDVWGKMYIQWEIVHDIDG